MAFLDILRRPIVTTIVKVITLCVILASAGTLALTGSGAARPDPQTGRVVEVYTRNSHYYLSRPLAMAHQMALYTLIVGVCLGVMLLQRSANERKQKDRAAVQAVLDHET